MPLQSRWPLFEASASTWLPSGSSASAKYSPFSIQKSRLKRRLRSAASFSSRSESSRSFQISRASLHASHLRVVRVALELAGRSEARQGSRPGTRSNPTSPSNTGSRGPFPRCGGGTRCSRSPEGRRTRRSSSAQHAPRARGRGRASCLPSSARTRPAERRRGRRVDRAVVRGMRTFLERRHLAVAHLVKDPAGVFVAEVVEPAPCQLPSAPSVVAASSGVNGNACRLVKMLSRPNIVMNQGSPAAGRLRPPAIGGEAQCGEVDEATPIRGLQRIPVALDARRLLDPSLQVSLHREVRPPRVTTLILTSARTGLSRIHVEVGRPFALWRDPDLERQTVLVEPRRSRRRDRRRTPERRTLVAEDGFPR